MNPPAADAAPRRLPLRYRLVLAAVVGVLVGTVVLAVSGGLWGVEAVLVILGVVEVAALGVVVALGLLLWRTVLSTDQADETFRGNVRQRLNGQGRRQREMFATIRRIDLRVSTLTSELARERQLSGEERQAAVHRRVTLERRAEQLHLDTQRQVQALLELQHLVPVEAPVPPMGGWAASADLVLLCVRELLDGRPEVIVECGSGVSTLYLALAVEQHRLGTRIVALEHDPQFLASTVELLERHGVGQHVQVRLAPLVPTSLVDHTTDWYDESAIADLSDIGMLLVDGPPGVTGPLARYPAVPLLRSRMASRCLVVMDDVDREEEHRIAELWHEEFPELSLQVLREYQKLAALLRL